MTPPDTAGGREQAREALFAYERVRERAFRRRLTIAALAIVPAVLLAAWFLLVGSQVHVVEIRVGDAAARLTSHEGPFEVAVPYETDVDTVSGGTLSMIEDDVEGPAVLARSYDAASFARTRQVVDRPADAPPEDFALNGRRFRIAGLELTCGERRWLLHPGRTLEVNIDRLPRPAGPPFAPPVPLPP